MNFVKKRFAKDELESVIKQYELNRTALEYTDILVDEKESALFIGEDGGGHGDPYDHCVLIWKDSKISVTYRFMHNPNPLIESWFIGSISAPKALEPIKDELFNNVIDAVQAGILRVGGDARRNLPVFEYIAAPHFT